ncbi:hypothetical protein D3875_12515 [Deinococcus cavernae]|uniref:Uncharacterized protein n=2 Tax=Deinococcus cavernae TaxID=2320857 RepID=A0A418V820_9DEIO|nr:hypothetical protein D3875_12515 [Deinococcus cavernae]
MGAARAGVLALMLALSAAGTASAQNLTAYSRLAQQLDAAAAAAGQDSLATLKQLDAAQAALSELQPTLSSAKLSAALQDTLNAVRAAQARTPAELQAQVQLARGLMRKALYDQTMNLLATTPANGSDHLKLLARELGVEPASVQTDVQAGHLNRAAWKLQQSATAKLQAALGSVQAQQSGAAYLNLARAAGWFTVVQDAARSVDPPLKPEQFSLALTQLSGGQLGELQGSLRSLRGGVAALSTSLKTPAAQTDSPVKGAVSSGKPPVSVPPAPSPATSSPATPPRVSPATTPGANTGATIAASLPRTAGADAAYASLGRALSATTRADLPAARRALQDALTALTKAPAALRNAPGYGALVQRVKFMAGRAALRPADVQALIGDLSTLEARQAGKSGSVMTALASGTALALGGGVRAMLALLLALVCAAPLYLLNLAFGGKNPFWRAISAALLLLLLPTLAEGLLGFLGWLGDTLNVPFLRGLLALTPGQSAFGVPLRMLITALALGLATYGFRGLCVQFGLLGGRRPAGPRPAPKPKQPDQTSFDWDEEL